MNRQTFSQILAREEKATTTMLKIPSIGSHTIVWTYKNAAHTRSTPEDGMWLSKGQGNWKKSQAVCLPKKQVDYLHKKRNAREEAIVVICFWEKDKGDKLLPPSECDNEWQFLSIIFFFLFYHVEFLQIISELCA